MAATATQGGGLTAAQEKVINSDAYADYLACEVEGMTRAERATQANKTPSTVSAAIKRIQEKIDAGEIPDPRSGDGTTSVRKLDRKDIAENILEGSSMFVEQMDKLEDEAGRVQTRMTALTTQLEELEEKRGRMRGLAERAGFSWDEFDAAVATAETSE